MRRPLSLDGLGPDARLLGLACVAAGLLTLALAALASGPGALEPADLLPYFQAHRTRYFASASVALLWILAALPFIASLRHLLGGGRGALALAAALLSTTGVALLGFGSFVAIGAFFALDSAGSGIAARLQAPYQAAIWRSLGFLLSDPGLMTLGGGQLVFSWLALGTTVPRWLAIAGFAGGIAGVLTLAVYQTPVLALVQLVSLAVCAFAAGAALLRRPAT